MKMGFSKIRTDCFAYVNKNGRHDCTALSELVCQHSNCSFYKKGSPIDTDSLRGGRATKNKNPKGYIGIQRKREI